MLNGTASREDVALHLALQGGLQRHVELKLERFHVDGLFWQLRGAL